MARRLLPLLLLALLLAGCGGAAAPAAKPSTINIKLAVATKSLNALPYYFGLEKGIFAAEGVNLDVQVLAANAGIAAVLNGNIDFTGAGGSAMRAAVEGSPVRGVYVTMGQPLSFLYAKQNVADVKSLRGKNIAITSVAGSPAVMIKAILNSSGLDPQKDVSWWAPKTARRPGRR